MRLSLQKQLFAFLLIIVIIFSGTVLWRTSIRRNNYWPNVMPISRFKNQTFLYGILRNENGHPIKIFLHDRFSDHVSRHIINERSWEYHIIEPLQKYMKADPELQFIDIGTYLGVYSLYVAKLGRQAIAVDADYNNIIRVAQSVKVNGLSKRVTLVHNAIADERSSFRLGEIRVESITAEDILKIIPFHKAVVKVDFEGRKASMFQKSAKLFEDLDIPLVIFSRATMLYCTEYIYEFMTSRGYTAFPNVNSTDPLRGHYKFWPHNIVWKRATKANPLKIADLTKLPNSRIVKYTNPIVTELFDKYTLKTEKGQLTLYGHDSRDMITESISDKGTWEYHLMAAIGKILKEDPSQGFIDVGSNIGVFTLVASQLGIKVIAVDANIQNLIRVRKSLTDNGIKDKVDLIYNAIDCTYSKVKLKVLPFHIGASHVVSSEDAEETAGESIDTIILDDLLTVTTFKKAVMKIDIEGKEYEAFKNASKLFNAIDISHVFMEWGFYKNPSFVHKSKSIIGFFKRHSYVPCSEAYPHRPLMMHFTGWPWDIVWIKNSYLY